MLRVFWKRCRRLSFPIFRLSNDKDGRVPPPPQIADTGKIEISREEMERIVKLVQGFDEGEQEGKDSEPVFKTKEQILSLQLLQAKGSADVLAMLRAPGAAYTIP